MALLYVNNNGTILAGSGPTINAGNRAHLYGDGLFETIRVIHGKPINLENHIQRIKDGAQVLKMRVPAFMTTPFFEEKMIELLQKSEISEGGKVRLSLDRTTGGTYLPESNEVTYFLEVYTHQSADFELNSKGLEIDLFTNIKKSNDVLANYKTKNGLIYVMAALNAKERGLDDVLISNYNGGILESSNSNLFVVSNGVLYTPGLEEGCLAGTMRMQIINLALNHGIKVYECNILPQNLLSADEIFLTNAVRGIVWVSGYRTKRYFNTIARKLVAFLNDHWEEQLGL